MSAAIDHKATLDLLLAAPKLTLADRSSWENRQGAYVFWLDSATPVCLKVGIALRTPKNGEDFSISERLGEHYASRLSNSVFARHLARDSGSAWALGFEFTSQADRQRFLATKCVVQMLAIPNVTRAELEAFEDYVEDELKPVYRGRIQDR